jgi:hypothetical protein
MELANLYLISAFQYILLDGNIVEVGAIETRIIDESE